MFQSCRRRDKSAKAGFDAADIPNASTSPPSRTPALPTIPTPPTSPPKRTPALPTIPAPPTNPPKRTPTLPTIPTLPTSPRRRTPALPTTPTHYKPAVANSSAANNPNPAVKPANADFSAAGIPDATTCRPTRTPPLPKLHDAGDNAAVDNLAATDNPAIPVDADALLQPRLNKNPTTVRFRLSSSR